VFNVLLQILDDGRLTDGQGRTVDFKNTVIIMTSNLGSQHIIEFKPGQEAEMRQMVMAALRAQFRPEFLNRVDEVIIFKALTRRQISQIVEIQLNTIRKRLSERHIEVGLTDNAKELLVEQGYDPVYGARPLKRSIQKLLLDPLALQVLEGSFLEGDQVVVDADGSGNLKFLRKRHGEVTELLAPEPYFYDEEIEDEAGIR
jgi:ATP-dependent Clp protease ATP-binding subunit ClpB